jgi:hypothetical protein
VPVWLELGVPVGDEPGVPVCELEPVPVWLELGVPVCDELGVPVGVLELVLSGVTEEVLMGVDVASGVGVSGGVEVGVTPGLGVIGGVELDEGVLDGVTVGVMEYGVMHTVMLSTSSSEGKLESRAFLTRKVRVWEPGSEMTTLRSFQGVTWKSPTLEMLPRSWLDCEDSVTFEK